MVEFKLSTFIITLLVFSVIIGGFAIPYGNLGKNYGIQVDTSFNETYNKISELEANVTLPISDDVKKEDTGDATAFVLAGRALLSAPKTVIASLGIVTSLLNADGMLAQKLKIPAIFINAALAIITVAVIFAIISLWARVKT